MSVYRGGDRFDDSRTSISSARRDGGYTTVKRYIVKDDDTRSSIGRDRRFPERPGERIEETRIVRREREVEEPPIREIRREEPRYATSELVIRRDKDDDRRDSFYRREEPTTDRELVIRRTTESAEPRREEVGLTRYDDQRDYRVSETRYRDGYEVVSPRGGFDDRDLQRYTRNTEYFAPAPQPQTIIIKNEPIIIRERPREEDYQLVRKSDIEEERSIVRREPEPKEEEYYYEKKVRERIDEQPRRRERSEDSWHERRSMRREVSPHDSVSQVGGRQRRGSYSSDDSMVYVRRTREYENESDGSSPHQKRNLAAGVVAGIGAAELLRNHKKKEGRETSHGIGRIGRDVGAGALGAIAAEGISRARSQYRSRSRRRKSRGRDESRSRSRRRSRSRSESRSKLKTLGALGLGAAALAAAATIAQKKMNKKNEGEASPERGRSESRGRHKGETVEQLANDPTADDARNPKHRNIRMAEAGAAGAAITALLDRARSKSRGDRDRSRSRVRQAVPVVAAGLGSAALAGLYEKNKAKKEAEAIAKEERKEQRRENRRKSRSRSRQRSEYFDGPSQAAMSDPHLIEYGDGPMHGNNFGPDYYGRPAPQEPYYAQQTAVVPAAPVPAAAYGATRDRSLSRDRRSRSRSASSSPGGHRRRRNRSRDAAEAAAAAGVGAVAASEYERKKKEKRERKARKREQEQRDPYEDTYNPQYTQPPEQYPAYAQPADYYPQSSQFPPPPGSGPQPYAAGVPTAPPGAAYNPQDYPPPPPPPGAPPAPGYDAYASGANPYAPRRDENVSVPPNPSIPNGLGISRGLDPAPAINVDPPSMVTPPPPPPPIPNPSVPSSYTPPTERTPSPPRPRAVSQPPPNGPRKSVQFAEKPDVNVAPESEASSPEHQRNRSSRDRTARGYEAGDDTDSTPDDMRRRAQRAPGESTRSGTLDPSSANGPDDSRRRRHHHRRRSADPSSSTHPSHHESSSSSRDLKKESGSSTNRPTSPADSDATVDLPARFDAKGRKKPEPGEDPVADRIDEILHGKGVGGRLFGNFVDGILGPDGRKKGGRDRDRDH